MCGRFALTLPHEMVAELFAAAPEPSLAARGPRWNVCPTQEVEAVVSEGGARRIARMRWGFLPRWYETPAAGPLLINARAETVAEKPAFREAVRETRCLVPASGFYEWRAGEGKAKTPFWLRPAAGGIVAFGGVWRLWRGPDGREVPTVAIVTTEANRTLAPIHHRLPLAVPPEAWSLWLGEAGKGAARLMTPPPEDFWAFHQVGAAVNRAGADGPGLIEPAGPAPLL